MSSITSITTTPYYVGDTTTMRTTTQETSFCEYRLMVLDLRKKETLDHNRIIFSIVGTVECRASAVLKEAAILKHLNDLSKIENIQDMHIDVVRLNTWDIQTS